MTTTRTAAQESKATQQATSTRPLKSGRLFGGQTREEAILHLQRTIGNHAVQRHLHAHAEQREASSSDLYEQEADRVAGQVMHTGKGWPAKRVPPGGLPETAAPPAVDQVLHSPGEPLDAATREFMEPRFGQNFGHVRVHSDASAAQSARDLHADAYTAGPHIVFGAGRLAPGSHEGRRLIAHELTHVVQQSGLAGQGGGRPVGIQKQEPKGVPSAPAGEAAQTEPPAEGADADIRQTLLKLFQKMDKAVVGEERFEGVISEKQWNAYKEQEAKLQAAREIDNFVEEILTGKVTKKPPIPVYTTCIALQHFMIKELGKQGFDLSLTKLQYSMGPLGKIIAQKIGPEVWHEGAPNMKDRPKAGDIVIMAFQDSKVVEAIKKVAYTETTLAEKQTAKEKLQAEIEKLKQEIAAAPEDKPKKSKGLDPAAVKAEREKKVAKLDTEMEKLRESQAQFKAKVKAAREKDKEDKAKWAEMQAKKGKQTPDFEFSHVGFMVSHQKMKYTKPGTKTEMDVEKWVTFDGGQTVDGKQGAKYVDRIYDPATNEIITGEADQRKGARLVKGWIDVDKLAKKKGK